MYAKQQRLIELQKKLAQSEIDLENSIQELIAAKVQSELLDYCLKNKKNISDIFFIDDNLKEKQNNLIQNVYKIINN
jgi:hypothetical protein